MGDRIHRLAAAAQPLRKVRFTAAAAPVAFAAGAAGQQAVYTLGPPRKDGPMQSYRAAVIGATGAVGSALVRELLRSSRCEAVTVLARRKVDVFDREPGAAKLTQIVIDMDHIEREAAAPLKGIDAAFCTMGVGQPSKVSKEEHWKVDVEYAAAFARACKTAGVAHLSLLGSVGADASSSSRYMNVKGAAEDALRAQRFERCSFFRPSLLITPELRYGFQDRVTQWGFPIVQNLLPKRFHGIRVEDLARAMRINAERPAGEAREEVLHYPEFQALLAEAKVG